MSAPAPQDPRRVAAAEANASSPTAPAVVARVAHAGESPRRAGAADASTSSPAGTAAVARVADAGESPLDSGARSGRAGDAAESSPGRVGFQLCVVTDGVGDGPRLLAILAAVLRAVPAGALAVQLRERRLSGAALYALAAQLRQLTAQYGAALLVNDRLDVALAVGADGVHLPTHGLTPATARQVAARAGARLLVSAACHSLAAAQQAVAGGADLITFGPIWPTPSKPDVILAPAQVRVHPVGVPTLAELTAAVPIPVFALGGVDDADRAAQCARAGARIACIRAVLSAPEPAAAARALLTALHR